MTAMYTVARIFGVHNKTNLGRVAIAIKELNQSSI